MVITCPNTLGRYPRMIILVSHTTTPSVVFSCLASIYQIFSTTSLFILKFKRYVVYRTLFFTIFNCNSSMFLNHYCFQLSSIVSLVYSLAFSSFSICMWQGYYYIQISESRLLLSSECSLIPS